MADPSPDDTEHLAVRQQVLRLLARGLGASWEEVAEAVDDGFRRAYPDPLPPEDQLRLSHSHAQRLLDSLGQGSSRYLPHYGAGLQVVRDESRADAVRLQVEDYFRRSLVKITEGARHFRTHAPDFALAEEAIAAVRTHHHAPAGQRRWNIGLPGGDYEIGLGDRPRPRWYDDPPSRLSRLPQPAGYVGPWDLDDATVGLVRQAIEAQADRFNAAVRVLVAFARGHGIDATPLLRAWDPELVMNVEACIQAEKTVLPHSRRPNPAPNGPTPADPTPPDQIDPEIRAIAAMVDYQKKHQKLLTVDAVVKLTPGTSRSSLYRSPMFMAAREAIKAELRGTVPKGHVTAGGGVDAEDYDDADDV
jgi:hypothetical protein